MFWLNKLFTKKRSGEIFSRVFTHKIIYIFFLIIMLIQFALVSIIFWQNKESKLTLQQANSTITGLEARQRQIMKKMITMESNIMRLTTQVYRLQPYK